MKLRALGILGLLVVCAAGCKKANHHDNARIPDPGTDKPAYNHRFDGGESDPYFKPGESSGAEGGEKGGKE